MFDTNDFDTFNADDDNWLPADIDGFAPEDAITYLQVDQRVTAWRASHEAVAYVAAGSGHAQVQEFLLLDPRPDHFGERAVRID